MLASERTVGGGSTGWSDSGRMFPVCMCLDLCLRDCLRAYGIDS